MRDTALPGRQAPDPQFGSGAVSSQSDRGRSPSAPGFKGPADGQPKIVIANSKRYRVGMRHVFGTYRNGTVVPDEPVDWPEGMHVKIVCESGGNSQLSDVCLDGSPWEDSDEAIQTWRDWFDSLEPVFTGEELEHFEAELRSSREAQKALLPQWEHRIGNLRK